jgi:hypothetical protein
MATHWTANFGLHVINLLNLDARHHLFKTDEFIYSEDTTNRYHDVAPFGRFSCINVAYH